MTDLARYVRAATRGLWGRERQALRAELLGHVEQRVQELRMGGLDQREAERLTLRELGAPAQVAAGMAQVHGLPALTRTGLSLALAGVLMVGAIQPGLAQVQVFDKDPPGFSIRPPYLSLNSLVEHLRRAGAGAQLSERRLRLNLGGAPATLRLSPGRSTSYGQDAVIRRQDGLYLRSDELVRLLADAGGPVSTLR